MSVSVNEKGGAERRINIIKRGRGQLHHIMLDEVIVNKAENYHLQCDRFLTNNIPALLQSNRDLVEIRPRYDQGGLFDPGYVPGNSQREKALNLKSTFRPPPIFSAARLCEAFSQFLNDFNFALYIYGANFLGIPETQANEALYVPEQAVVAQGGAFDLRNHTPPNDVTRYISVGFDSAGSVVLVLSSQFLSNFYIRLDTVFAKQIGFPELIYADDDQNGIIVMSNQPGVGPLIDEDALLGNVFNLNGRVHEGRSVRSIRSIYSADERLSIDVEIALPLAQSIDVENGKEVHTFLLSRFVIGDYQNYASKAQQSGGVILTKTVLEDKLGVGAIDLVQDAPESHVAHMLSGKIQQLNMRLVLRYKNYRVERGKLVHSVERRVLELDHSGLYDILLQFNKRV